MTWLHVKILLKSSLFMFLGLLFVSGLGMILALILLPNLSQNVEYLTNYFLVEKGMPRNIYVILLFIGLVTLTMLLYYLGFSIAYWLIEKTFGWQDVEEKYPKLFGDSKK